MKCIFSVYHKGTIFRTFHSHESVFILIQCGNKKSNFKIVGFLDRFLMFSYLIKVGSRECKSYETRSHKRKMLTFIEGL